MKSRTKRLFAMTMALAITCSGMIGCGKGESSEKKDAKELNIALAAEPDNLDMCGNTDTSKNMINMAVQEPLLDLNEEGQLVGAGASDWTISEDGLVYTFTIRDNKYADGTEVKAEDYENGLMRVLDPQVASQYGQLFYPIAGAEEYSIGDGKEEDVKIEATDDKTLVITLEEPVPYFIQMFSIVNATPIPEKNSEGEKKLTYGSDKDGMSYSGPFMIEEWNRGSGLVLKKNPNYWDAENVKVDTVNLILAADVNTRQQMFEQGQIDLLEGVNAEYLNKVGDRIDKGEFKKISVDSPSITYICFNNEDPNGIFTNEKIRLAFSLAFDRETFVDKVLQKNVAAYGIVPPATSIGDMNFREEVEEPLLALKDMDPKQLLEEGLKEIGKEGEQIEVTFLQRNAENESKVQAEFYQNQWQKNLGVTVKIDTASDSATFNTTVQNGQYQVCSTGWGADYNDPMTFMSQYITNGANPAFSSDATFDKLLEECTVESDMTVRKDKFAESEIIAVEKAFVAPVCYGESINLVASDVDGISFKINKPIDFKNVVLK